MRNNIEEDRDTLRDLETFLSLECVQINSSKLEVPLVDWEVSDVRTADAKRSPMTFSVRPLVDQLLVDYIIYKGWTDIVYIHDGANGEAQLAFH